MSIDMTVVNIQQDDVDFDDSKTLCLENQEMNKTNKKEKKNTLNIKSFIIKKASRVDMIRHINVIVKNILYNFVRFITLPSFIFKL